MFDDFEDPFALPMEELELAAPPRAVTKTQRAPAYTTEEVRALAAFGEAGDMVKNVPYAVRTRQRTTILHDELQRHRVRLRAALQTRDEELILLASKLPAKDGALDTSQKQLAMDALEAGEAGAILAAPSLGAFSRVRAASRDAALHAAAINTVDDAAYRRGAEFTALSVSFALIALTLLLLL